VRPAPAFCIGPDYTEYAYLCTYGYHRDKNEKNRHLAGRSRPEPKCLDRIQMPLSNEPKPPYLAPQTSPKMLRLAISIAGRKTNPKNTPCLSAYDLP
jgi:hypothetical protein